MTDSTTIVCPKCGAEIPLSEAVSHRIREQLARDFDEKRRAQEAGLVAREQALANERETLERARQTVEEQVRAKVEAGKAKILAEAQRQVQDQLAVEMEDLRAQVSERNRKLQQAQAAELTLRQQQRELEDQRQALDLEIARKLDAERGKLREEVQRSAVEAERFKLAEKEKVISDLQREIQNLKQKAEQGSMQLQGEVLELDLEARLAAQFPLDGIEPVAKGQRGADMLQRVRTNTSHDCGSILWETKRAKNWSKDWSAKLKEDQRAARADLAVLVSHVLPAEVKGFGWFDGVWMCDTTFAMPLAVALRQGLVTAAVARQNGEGRQSKMEELFAYLTSLEFRQRVEGVVEAFKTMGEDLEAEKRVLQKHWARREKQLDQAINHTASLYGSVQGIVGPTVLPEICILQLEDSTGDQIENQNSKIEN